ncbi:MAG: tetratricopeptide repeat protein [Planctomycetota bacterium]
MVRRSRTRMLSLAAALTAALAPAGIGCQSQPSANTLRFRGDLALEQKKFFEAVEWYEQYLRRRPGDGQARYSLGRAYLNLDQPSRAREQFIQGLELGATEGLFIDGIAETLVETGQRDELFRLLRRTAEQERNAENYIRFGRFAALVGDADTAEEAFLTAARADQGRTIEPQLALADFYASVNDTAQELERLRMALWVDPEHPDVQARIIGLGEVPGPAFVLQPAERR